MPPIVNKIDALLARSTKPIPPPPPVATGSDGTITIPAVSYTSKNHSASVRTMIGFADGVQLLHNGCASSVGPPCFEPLSSAWTYTFKAATAGTFYLTANFNTWHYNQDLMVSVNGAKEVEVPVFYSLGWWNRSQPIKATLVKGNNSMTFSRQTVRELVLKEFLLSPKEPVIPKPPAPFNPVPSPYVRRIAAAGGLLGSLPGSLGCLSVCARLHSARTALVMWPYATVLVCTLTRPRVACVALSGLASPCPPCV